MSEMTPAKATALRKPFPPESVGQLPKGGTMLDYVGHAAVTDRLLTVDPEWSWDFALHRADGTAVLDDGSGNLWITLTVCGVTRLGVGDGKNAKERIGDAIRNAAMRFGVALDLWAKENLVEFAQAASAPVAAPPAAAPAPAPSAAAKPPKPMTMNTRRMMHVLFDALEIPDAQQLPGINQILGTNYTSRKELTEDDGVRLVAVLQKRKQEAR
jgi:hypothetical protein